MVPEGDDGLGVGQVEGIALLVELRTLIAGQGFPDRAGSYSRVSLCGCLAQHRPGSGPRTVSCVYATRSPAKDRNLARWWYQAPGGTSRVGGGWRGGRTVKSWTEISAP
ncbi:hypothetical protein [Streptomyces sp. HUAS TT7]|uniref:hypothetical protein n=1 Tax=Streptomyces sp. HUAS TT7 TaxID=3447507 RepID=UPI003F65BC66